MNLVNPFAMSVGYRRYPHDDLCVRASTIDGIRVIPFDHQPRDTLVFKHIGHRWNLAHSLLCFSFVLNKWIRKKCICFLHAYSRIENDN